MGFVLLFGLSALAATAALGIASRARLRGRAETLVAATLLWNAIVLLPIYVLGLLNVLTGARLALASVVVSLAAGAAACAGVGARPLLGDVVRLARGLLRLPIEALVMSWRARSLIFVGVLFAAILLPYLALSAWLTQPLPLWDPLWYHDTMVGFTIQNHGFAMVPLPDTLQKVNGYVRLGEMTQLWMVIFADRRLADLTNLLFAPTIAAATYALARRYAEPLIAVGWGVAVIISPTCAGLLHSTYVDPQYAALLLGGILFTTVDSPRIADGLLAGLALALTIGSKGLALIPVPIIGVIGAWALLRAHWRGRRAAAIATVAGGLGALLLVAATTYLRNYWAFHNPFWPDMRVEVEKLGIHWPGLGPWSSDSSHRGGGVNVNLNEPLPSLLNHLYSLPWSIKGMYFDQAIEYGIGFIWVVIPLGAAAFFACWARAIRMRLRGAWALPRAPLPTLLALSLVAIIAGSPALWGPRYHIGGMGVFMALAAWLTGRPPRDRLGEAAAATVLVTSLMMFWWTPLPRWWATPEILWNAAHASPVEREVDRALGAPTTRVAGMARERELGPGTLLVFNERYSGFPSLFWNRDFSNRVQYMKGGPDFLARAASAGATWVFLNDRDPTLAQARAPNSGWQDVGVLNPINGGFAFRRVPVVGKPPALKPVAPPPPPRPVARPPAPVAPPAKLVPAAPKPAAAPAPAKPAAAKPSDKPVR